MKSFKEVEDGRRAYHRDGTLNSVHRSSLTVPEIEGSEVEISFINHFLLKRGYKNVACRITAFDPQGHRIESRLLMVDEPRVYTLPLSGMVSGSVDGYLVDFFAAENLYIPFPAVMVNHRGPRHLNSVHSYNRVLNDIFEDDSVNATQVREASMDVCIDEHTDTFALFTAGPQACRGTLGVELATAQGAHRANISLDVPRLCSREISLRDCFPNLSVVASGTLKLDQPEQFLFYGRMLTGIRRCDGAFSANHSYYDSSTAQEYWDDNRPSRRLYPFFQGLDNSIRMYPIMSPGSLAVAIELYGEDGERIGDIDCGTLECPGDMPVDRSVTDACETSEIDTSRVSAFAVRATPRSGNTPTRVNHQLVHGPLSGEGLSASVNISLNNPNTFMPAGKTGFAWGQVPVGTAVESVLGLVGNIPESGDCALDVTFYDERGVLGGTAIRSKRWQRRVYRSNGCVFLGRRWRPANRRYFLSLVHSESVATGLDRLCGIASHGFRKFQR
jgi:hypothetical protein